MGLQSMLVSNEKEGLFSITVSRLAMLSAWRRFLKIRLKLMLNSISLRAVAQVLLFTKLKRFW